MPEESVSPDELAVNQSEEKPEEVNAADSSEEQPASVDNITTGQEPDKASGMEKEDNSEDVPDGPAADGESKSSDELDATGKESEESPLDNTSQEKMLDELARMESIDGMGDDSTLQDIGSLTGQPGDDYGNPEGDVAEVKTADFQQLTAGTRGHESHNLDLLMDVTLPISIELGRTSMNIQEILNLGPGSIVELDKLAGEPVDLLVNNKIVARGEVVVLDENFGIRVTSLVSTEERLRSLGE